jgi:hypothetical protein
MRGAVVVPVILLVVLFRPARATRATRSAVGPRAVRYVIELSRPAMNVVSPGESVCGRWLLVWLLGPPPATSAAGAKDHGVALVTVVASLQIEPHRPGQGIARPACQVQP